eukprot:3184556-Rhodomonas_salina.2
MTSLNWKGSKVSPIKDFASSDGVVHLSDFKMWRNNAVRNVKAAGGTWITRLFDKIKMVNNKIPRLCYQSKDDEYDSIEFKKLVVAMALAAGKYFKDDHPATDSDANVKKSYDSVKNDIQSFGAQISKAAPKEKQDIFNQTELMEFPLCTILEWHALYRSYDPHLDTDPTTYWNTLNNVMAEELDMGIGKISDWVSRVSNARTDLIKCESSEAADSAIIGPTITKFMDL